LHSVYYDTPDLDLRRRGISLRVRHVDGRRLQTVKCDGADAPQLARLECEHEIEGERPDLTCVEETGLQQLFSDVGAPALLQPMFATEIDRTAWQFNHDGAAIECALDMGKIRAGKKSLPVRELELELKSGEVAGLFEAADAISRKFALPLEWESKSQRGYALVAGLAPQPPQRLPLSPKMDVSDAMAAIARDCIAVIAVHAPLVLKRGEIEDVHRMRVGVRRLRAAISTFRRAMGGRRLAFEGDLRWLQDQLGAVRNWDVARADTIAPLLRMRPADEDLAQVDEAGSDARDAAYANLRAALGWSRNTRGANCAAAPGSSTSAADASRASMRQSCTSCASAPRSCAMPPSSSATSCRRSASRRR
jgi:inorganic triphosphatase YgiF